MRNRMQVTNYYYAVSQLPQLNYPAFKFKVSQLGDRLRIWDSCRGQWLVLTPEEWVRQNTIRFFIEYCGFGQAMISQECPVHVEGTKQRADIVVYGSDARPMILVECKAPDVDINADVFRQVVRYNAILQAQYIVVTNGLKHFIHEREEDGRYTALPKFPWFDS